MRQFRISSVAYVSLGETPLHPQGGETDSNHQACVVGKACVASGHPFETRATFMKLFFWRTGLAALTLLLFFHQATVGAQTPATNYVLQLSGGTNSWLELPSGAFNYLEEATIEGWVNWQSFKSCFFDFGNSGQMMLGFCDTQLMRVRRRE